MVSIVDNKAPTLQGLALSHAYATLTFICDLADIDALDVGHVSEHAKDDEPGVYTRQRVADAHQDGVPKSIR